jgi:hypothetical protein
MKTYRYHFHIPNYTSKSNGIVLLWEAAYNFSEIREITISSFGYGEIFELVPQKYYSLIRDYNKSSVDCVVVYPEAITNNPLESSMVARYLMAKPYILNGAGIEYGEDDFIFSYSNSINADLDQYNLINPFLLELTKYKCKKKKGKISIYYGKCRLEAKFKNISNIIKNAEEIYVITRTFPHSKEELYRNLAESQLLISLDPLTNILYEATILGTPVLTLDDIFDSSYTNYNYELFGFNPKLEELGTENAGGEALRVKVIDKLNEQLSTAKFKTNEIILKIESHFSRTCPEPRINYNNLAQQDRDFFENIWMRSAIYNCSDLRSIIIFHALRKNVYLLFIIKILYRVIKDLLSFPRTMLIILIKRYLNDSEIAILKIRLMSDTIKTDMTGDINNVRSDGLAESGVEKKLINKFIVRFLWRSHVL